MDRGFVTYIAFDITFLSNYTSSIYLSHGWIWVTCGPSLTSLKKEKEKEKEKKENA